eukprot:bmy_19420T0
MLGHHLPHFNWAAIPTVANPTSIWYEGLTPQHPAAASHQHPCCLPRSGLRLGSVPAQLPSSAVSTAALCPRFRGIPSCSAPSPLPTHLYPTPPSVLPVRTLHLQAIAKVQRGAQPPRSPVSRAGTGAASKTQSPGIREGVGSGHLICDWEATTGESNDTRSMFRKSFRVTSVIYRILPPDVSVDSGDSLLSRSLHCEPEDLKVHSPSIPGPDFLPRSSTTMRVEPMNSTNIYDANEDYFGLANSSDYSLDVDSFLCSLQEVRKFSGLFVPLAYSLICVSGLLGNILVVVTFAFYKKAKSMTDVYLLNMAVADILFVLTLPFWAVNHATGEWIFSNVMCKLTRGIYAINFNCGMLLLTCISLDRYIAIVQATKSFWLRSRTLAHHKVICLVVWVVSILISSSTFMFNQKYKLQGSEVCEPRYHTVSEPIRWKLLVLGLQLLFGFFIPLVFMIFCYMFIVKTLIQAQNSKRHRAIRVIIAVVLVFLACQIPHNMVLLVTAVNLGRMDRSCSSERLLGYTRNVTEVLAFLHCCLNPVLYAFVGQKFRSYFLKIMKDLWCVRRRQKSLGFSCSRLHSDNFISRQNSETADNDNPSSFTM